jgi:hypothetical protein
MENKTFNNLDELKKYYYENFNKIKNLAFMYSSQKGMKCFDIFKPFRKNHKIVEDSFGNLCKNLPKEIIYSILEYGGIIRKRNNKYMWQLSKNDMRYKLLNKIPRMLLWYKLNTSHVYVIPFKNRRCYLTKYVNYLHDTNENYEKLSDTWKGYITIKDNIRYELVVYYPYIFYNISHLGYMLDIEKLESKKLSYL